MSNRLRAFLAACRERDVPLDTPLALVEATSAQLPDSPTVRDLMELAELEEPWTKQVQ